MTELAVNTWLKHWLTRQQKSKRPLMLKDPSEHHATTRTIPKVGSGSKTRIQWVEPDDEEIEPIEDEEGEENAQDNDNDDGDGSEQPGNGPATPASCAVSEVSTYIPRNAIPRCEISATVAALGRCQGEFLHDVRNMSRLMGI